MESYISAPEVHANATRNPRMLGGPFVDYGHSRVPELKRLLAWTKESRRDAIELSSALNALNECLVGEAVGWPLQGLYERLPAILRGFVELGYDLNNRASFRVLEPLLYRSRYYDPDSQSLMLRRISSDDRPFVLSTPRLDDQSSVHINIPFSDPRVDKLFQLKTSPKPWNAVQSLFSIPEESAQLFRSFFTAKPPSPYKPYLGTGIRWRYFGHACILIEASGVSILVDPVLSYTYESAISRYTYADLPDTIDYVLITHNHQDHILIETLLQLRHKIRTIVVPRNGYGMLHDPSLRLMFENIGFENVIEMSECERLRIPNGEVIGWPFFGEHADLCVGTKLAYLVRVGRKRLLFAADSCNIEPAVYEHLQRAYGDVDVVFIGMECDGAPLSWLYGALLPRRLDRAMDQSRRLSGSNCQQAQQIVRQFNCSAAYIYAMGQEPWLNYIMSIKYTDESKPIVESNKLIAECERDGIHAERLFGEKEILMNDRVGSVISEPRGSHTM